MSRTPDFTQVERTSDTSTSRVSMRTYTGTIPEYATEVEGLLLGGVMAGGPAEQAGLQKGDVIVEFAGTPVLNIYDYMNALEAARDRHLAAYDDFAASLGEEPPLLSEIRQQGAHSFRRQFVEVGRLARLAAIGRQGLVAHVVRHDEYDVGALTTGG